ncbi:MAG: UDP-glucose/GDP-mannose dehydrogenase family protein [Zetaproteobacteria bacterium]|nr:UDP-glucose/GDP-mannose dehydrogenase family protein [Zetaproteobacteria bacterium]
MRILMVGTGYVGLVSGVCLAECGHDVICADIDENKVQMLRKGKSPIYEPGIEQLMSRAMKRNRLRFSTNLEEDIGSVEAVFIAVGTPPGEDGAADLVYVERVASDIAQTITKPLTVIVKSTVPVGSCERVESIIQSTLATRKLHFTVPVVSNPEFLKEGNAIRDFLKPDRIVIGTQNQAGQDTLAAIYAPFTQEKPDILVWLDRRSAELTKYAANAMLATRISFMNELAMLCESAGGDIEQVRRGIASDPRIGPLFLRAGAGYGGSCFPKDVKALRHLGNLYGTHLGIMNAVHDANEVQKNHCFELISKHFNGALKGKSIAIWGLSFKPETDDVREAPALTIVQGLVSAGAKVKAYDPQGGESFAAIFGAHPNFQTCLSTEETLESADALTLLTEWSEFRFPNWQAIALTLGLNAPVFDLRNFFDRETVSAAGLHYIGIGRPSLPAQPRTTRTKLNKGEHHDRTIEPQA